MKRTCGKWGLGRSHSFRVALNVASMACLWAMVVAEVTSPPTAAAPPASERCTRDLVSTVWGFLVTLVAFTLDEWGYWKNNDNDFGNRIGYAYFTGFLNPLIGFTRRLRNLLDSWEMRKRMSTDPEARSYIRILSGCQVVVNLSPPAHERFLKLIDFEDTHAIKVVDFSDALVIGNEDWNTGTPVQLSPLGKEMLVRALVLPSVERLKILQGYSGVTMAVSAAQGVGYIHGVLVRVVEGRHVSPVEAIAFYLSILILMKAMVHYYTSSCHRPLLLFLNPEMETKFVDKCEEPHSVRGEWHGSTNYAIWALVVLCGGTTVLSGGALVYLSINIGMTTSWGGAIPLFILVITTPVTLYSFLKDDSVLKYVIGRGNKTSLRGILFLMNTSVYFSSLKWTFQVWQSFGLNIKSSGYLSKILPHIG